MKTISVEAIINAPRDVVWNAYTQPESIQNWAFASDDWECPFATNDLQVGGRFLTRMQAKDESDGFDFTGTYTDVVLHECIAYVMDKAGGEIEERTCVVTFVEAAAATTKVVVTFDAETINPLELQQAGWQGILNNFKKCVET
jgi:uncharacterized protein YndB with AHSA1/START domain